MTVCEACRQPYAPGVSCTRLAYEAGGHSWPRVAYGSDTPAGYRDSLPAECSDCSTPLGGYHHRWGSVTCDQDRCVHGQALTCASCDLILRDGSRVMAGTAIAIREAQRDGWRL